MKAIMCFKILNFGGNFSVFQLKIPKICAYVGSPSVSSLSCHSKNSKFQSSFSPGFVPFSHNDIYIKLKVPIFHNKMSIKAITWSSQLPNLISRCLHPVLSIPKTKLTSFRKCPYEIPNNLFIRKQFSETAVLRGTAGHSETTATTQGLSKLQAQELILRLNGEERHILLTAIQEFQSNLTKAEFEGQLAASKWRSKFGRPSKLPRLGEVDPTGTYCPVPEDWLKKKCAENIPKPTNRNLVDIGIANAIPFIGFGFLDNFFMIIFGDSIDLYLGSYFVLSTMAAAAIGNTISDILGIGTAFYVERLANKIGFEPPKLSPVQMDMLSSRNAANLGRILGVTIGCILGMCPLLFNTSKEDEQHRKVI